MLAASLSQPSFQLNQHNTPSLQNLQNSIHGLQQQLNLQTAHHANSATSTNNNNNNNINNNNNVNQTNNNNNNMSNNIAGNNNLNGSGALAGTGTGLNTGNTVGGSYRQAGNALSNVPLLPSQGGGGGGGGVSACTLSKMGKSALYMVCAHFFTSAHVPGSCDPN